MSHGLDLRRRAVLGNSEMLRGIVTRNITLLRSGRPTSAAGWEALPQCHWLKGSTFSLPVLCTNISIIFVRSTWLQYDITTVAVDPQLVLVVWNAWNAENQKRKSNIYNKSKQDQNGIETRPASGTLRNWKHYHPSTTSNKIQQH